MGLIGKISRGLMRSSVISRGLKETSKANAVCVKVARATKPDAFIHFGPKAVNSAQKAGVATVTDISAEFNSRRLNLLNSLRTRKVEEEAADFILRDAKPETIDIYERIVANPNADIQRLNKLSESINKGNKKVIEGIVLDADLNLDKVSKCTSYSITEENAEIFKKLLNNGEICHSDFMDILDFTKNSQIADAVKALVNHDGVKVDKNLFSLAFHLSDLESNPEALKFQTQFIKKLCESKNLKIDNLFDLRDLLRGLTEENAEFIQKLVTSRSDLKCVSGLLPKYNSKSKKFFDKFLEIAPKDYDCAMFSIHDCKLGERFLDVIQNVSSPSDKAALLDILSRLRNEEDMTKLIVKIKENPQNIKAISTEVIVKSLREGQPELVEKIVKSIINSGKNFNASEISDLAVYYPKSETIQKVFDELMKHPDAKTCDLITIAQDLLKSKTFMDEKAKVLELLLGNKNLKFEEILELYKSANNALDAKRIVKYMNNPKFVQNLRVLRAKTDKELEFLLGSKVLKPENYSEYISVVHHGEPSAKEIAQRWKFLEKMLSKYPQEDKNIISILYNINSKNKSFAQALIKRNISPNDIRVILSSSHFSDIRNLTDEEIDFFKKFVMDKNISNDAIINIFSVFRKPDCKELSKLYAKYPAKLKKALNFGIHAENISQLLQNKNFEKILEQISTIPEKYNIKIKVPLEIIDNYQNSSDLFLTLRTGDGILLKFNKKSGKLLTISQDKLSLNVRNGIRSSSFALREMKDNLVDAPYYMESFVEKSGQKPIKQIYTESTVPGQFEIFSQAPDGRKTKIGIVREFASGKKYIQRHLKSLDGSVSEYKYKTDRTGNRLLQVIIKDKDGKVISKTTKTFKKLSENHFISTVNGQAYDIEFMTDKVVTTKLDSLGRKTSEIVEYKIQDMPDDLSKTMIKRLEQEAKTKMQCPENPEQYMKEVYERIFREYGIEPYTIDRNSIDLMKNLSGDEWFAMRKSCPYVVGNNFEANNACFAGSPIFMSKELLGNYGVFSHELGHAKFQALGLGKDKELMRIYNAEKRRFTQTFPEADIDSISYFLEGNAVNLRGVNEGCAETNLINNIPQSWAPIQDRTIIWEQYFPNTRAYLEKKLSSLVA